MLHIICTNICTKTQLWYLERQCACTIMLRITLLHIVFFKILWNSSVQTPSAHRHTCKVHKMWKWLPQPHGLRCQQWWEQPMAGTSNGVHYIILGLSLGSFQGSFCHFYGTSFPFQWCCKYHIHINFYFMFMRFNFYATSFPNSYDFNVEFPKLQDVTYISWD